MSATVQTYDFPAKARELRDLIATADRVFQDADRLALEIAEAADGDDCGGLKRLGFAVAGEARSLSGVFKDAEHSIGLRHYIADADDLVALVDLAATPREGGRDG